MKEPATNNSIHSAGKTSQFEEPPSTPDADAPLPAVKLFSTAPQSADYEAAQYRARLSEIARWSEQSGCTGILIYSDNSLIDPWLAAQIIIRNTSRLSPLVAIQPVYLHPYAAAKMVASLGFLYGRRLYLNMIAGGFRGDLFSLGDATAHDDRYVRLEEYTLIIQGLLSSKKPFSFAGRFYEIKNLQMKPALSPELLPEVFVSGTSEAGMQAAKALDAVSIEYPQPGAEYVNGAPRQKSGIRIGVIAAQESEQAWEKAYKRFPGDKAGQLKHLLAMKVSDSHWHKQLSNLERETQDSRGIYWLWPFKNYNTFCPYLVGSYDEVANEILKYLRAGFTNYILDIPAEPSDLFQAGRVFRMAESRWDAQRQDCPESASARLIEGAENHE
jgi:alkanesulfonate monooxygenase